MKRSLLAAVAVSSALFSAPGTAHAEPLCEHRGEAHAAQQHTTREADSRWHVEHGQLPTCDLDQKDDKDDHDDDQHDVDLPGHRDHEGFHCYHLHCG